MTFPALWPLALRHSCLRRLVNFLTDSFDGLMRSFCPVCLDNADVESEKVEPFCQMADFRLFI